jgi:aspartyl-tRNA(Asn)/glutamyl-tRNA(Gln) amidotransferase subunit C
MRVGMPSPSFWVVFDGVVGSFLQQKPARSRGLRQRRDNTRIPFVSDAGAPSRRAMALVFLRLPAFRFSSMSLTSTDIARIASLARLQLAADESERMLGQINGFFELVERMRAVDTTGLEPLAHPVGAVEDVTLRLAADVASEPNRREVNQRSAPAVENGLFLVPKVIE